MARVMALSPSLAMPTGVVQFTIDGVKQPTTVTLDSTGQAALLLSGIVSGQHLIHVDYFSTDGNFLGSSADQLFTLTFSSGNRQH
jgi:hypothetical protein